MHTGSALATSLEVCNPKRTVDNRRGRAGWYSYYAGFSPSFVRDALAISRFRPSDAQVLDPWNGSGTTTEVAAAAGFRSLGFDLNPVMVIVAKARMLNEGTQSRIASVLEGILLRAEKTHPDGSGDPLRSWFSNRTCADIRAVEMAIQTSLVNPRKYVPLAGLASLEGVSPLAAFFYVALFRALRHTLDAFRCSNPTWIKGAGEMRERIHMSRPRLLGLVRRHAEQMARDLESEETLSFPEPGASAVVDISSSLSLPIADRSVQLVVTSPPYCTRIDYVIKTAPELAVLGLGNGLELRSLRDKMIGTPTIADSQPACREEWGSTCGRLLRIISDHRSRASRSYYLKTYLQYFDALFRSLTEIDRTLDRPGECFVVVQDSYYKEMRVDLARITTEMAYCLGWGCDFRRDFPSSRTMVKVNRGSRAYKNPKLAVESVLRFVKARAVA